MASKKKAQCLQSLVIANYFEKKSEDPTDHFYKCLISETCVKPISGKKLFNLVAHAKTHKDFFQQNYSSTEDELKNMPTLRLEIIQHCAELVTINSEPFALFNKSGFLKMNKHKLQVLKNASYDSGLAAPACTAVKDHIKYLSAEIYKKIGAELEGKFMSLMVDGATKYHRSILGIYVQFMDDFHIVTRAIGMVNLSSRHTGKHLASVICDRLNLLGIKTSQLIAITTDNATNMSSMVRCLNQEACENDEVVNNGDNHDLNYGAEPNAEEDGHNGEFPEFSFSIEKDYDAILKNFLNEMEIGELCADSSLDELEGQPDLDSTLQEIQSIIDSQTLNIRGIRCAIHTLQLGVMSALKEDEFKSMTRLCRGVCKELRKKSNQIELTESGIDFKIPRTELF